MSAFKDFCNLAKTLLKTLSSSILALSCLATLGSLFLFFTPSFADDTPPTITGSNPPDEATNAPIEINNFYIQFSEPMDQQSVLDSPIRLGDLTTGQLLPGDWAGGALDSLQDFVDIGMLQATFDGDGDRLNLFSDVFLLFPEHIYRITFVEPIQAKDLAGNTLSTATTMFTFTTVAVQPTQVSGTISTNTTWGIAGNPYTLTGNLTVASGVTLTILPGVEVRFGDYYELVVNGQLIAQGTKQDAIFFTSTQSSPNPGDWNRIVFQSGASGQFKDCIFKYSRTIESVNASLTITESRIQKFSGAGLSLQSDSAVTLSATHNDISYNQVGISLSGSHPSAVVQYNDITHNDTGVHVNGSFQTLEFNNISENTNYELYNNTSATVQAKNNYWGTTDASLIANKIYDVSDNPSIGKVNYSPLLPSSGITSIQGPKNASVLINNGDATTTSHNVTLTLSADSPTPTEMIISESPTFAGASYETYATSKSFTLSGDEGVKYVYAQFKDGSGNESAVAFDLIFISSGPTEVSGIISSDMTWGIAGSPYIVTGHVVINSGVTLTVEPGVVLKFDGDYKIEVDGTLNANGTADNRIMFTSNKATPSPGDWDKIYFKDGCGGGSFTYCDFRYGGSHGETVYARNGVIPEISYNTFADVGGSGNSAALATHATIVRGNTFNMGSNHFGLLTASGTQTVTENTFTGEGIYTIQGSSNTISNNTIDGNGSYYGIYFQDNGSGGTITGNTIANCSTAGIYGYRAGVTITNNTITGCGKGIDINSLSTVQFNNIYDNTYNFYCRMVRHEHSTIDVKYNWWGTTDAEVLAGKIYDFYDNSFYSVVNYSPMLGEQYMGIPPAGPSNPSVVINGGASSTTSRYVTLTLSAGATATEMIISENHNFVGATYEPYATTKAYTLSSEVGAHYVYAKFRDASQSESAIAFAFINLINPNILSGFIETDKTLTAPISPYIVTGNVVINSGVTLMVEPGVVVKFDGDYKIEVDGTLNANGTADNRIMFTTNKATPSPGDWDKIYFRDGCGGGSFTYCDFRYGGSHGSTVYARAGTIPEISYNTFADVGGFGNSAALATHATIVRGNTFNMGSNHFGLLTASGTQTVTENMFTGEGIYTIQGSSNTISNNTIDGNGSYYGIYFQDNGSGSTITGNTITNCSTAGIYGYRAGVTITNNTIIGCGKGIDINSLSTVQFNNIYDNTYNFYCRMVRHEHSTIDVKYNWWGTTDAEVLAGKIYDFYDNSFYSVVNYSPMLGEQYMGIPPAGPSNPSVVINGGASSTTSRYVTLTLSAGATATEMIISENHNFVGATYEPYATTKAYTLSSEIGAHYVYAKFRDVSQNESAIAFAFINLTESNILSGFIDADTTLTESISPYIVTGHVVINSGVTLTVEPGVVVKFDGDYKIEVDGTLNANGTADNRIMFTTNKATPSPGDWDKIYFRDGCGGGSFTYCDFRYGGSHGETVYARAGTIPEISYNTFADVGGFGNSAALATHATIVRGNTFNMESNHFGLLTASGTQTVTENTFTGEGIYTIQGSPDTISNNTIDGNGSSCGIRFQDGGGGTITGNTITNCSTAGIYGFGGTITNNTITGCGKGIDSEGRLSTVQFNNIYDNTYNFYCTVARHVHSTIDVKYNWWGTTDAEVLAGKIYDFYDNSSYSVVNYSPMLGEQYTGTPPAGPSNPSVTITDYLGTVANPILQLQLSADSPTQMLISDDHTFPTQYQWETFASTKNFQSDGTKYIYVKFKDADGNESAIAFTQPKQMVYIQKSALLGNKPVLLQVKVPSGFGVAQVRGFYRAIGGGSYTEQLMTQQGGIYCLWIPDGVTGNGIEYYIQAEDSSSNVLATLPETNPSTNPYSLSAVAILQQSVQASQNNAFEFAVGVTIEIPAGALSSDTNLQVSPLSTSPTPPSGITATDIGYNLAMEDGTTVFLQPVSITFNYADSDVEGIDESTLRVYYWDGNAWRFAGGTVDADANSISVQTTHFTDFAVFGGSISETSLTLKRGLNLITIPYSTGTYTSHSLIRSISGCKVVTPWDATLQGWGQSAFDAGGGAILPPSPFNIKASDGYFVQVGADTTTTVGSVALTAAVTLNLKRGLNLISIPYSSGCTSHSLIQSITGCKVVTPWNATLQGWGESAFDAGGESLGPDFDIEVGSGYFVQVDADTSWTPSASPAPALWARTGGSVAQISNLESRILANSATIRGSATIAGVAVVPDYGDYGGSQGLPLPQGNFLIEKKRRGTAKIRSTAADDVKITDIRESNFSSSSVTISWVTDSITDGRVRYGTTPEHRLGTEPQPYGWSTVADERGMDDVHWVQITGLSPETTYFYEVVSGESVDDNDGKLYTFTTSKIGQGIPYLIYSQILKDDQSTPAVGAVVYVTVEHGDVASSMLSAVVGKGGFWQVNLGNLKNPETNDVLSYIAGDAIHIFAQGGADGVAEMETTVSGNSPQSIQPDLILQSSEISEFSIQLEAGLSMISLPLKPPTPYTAKSFADAIGATVVIKLDEKEQKFIGFTPDDPTDGFPIEGGKGYIVNVEEGKVVTFTGTAWTNAPTDKAAPSGEAKEAWAFVISGLIEGRHIGTVLTGGYRDTAPTILTVQVKNLRTGAVMRDVVSQSGYFSVASADLSQKSIIQAGDKLEVSFTMGKVGYRKIIREVKIDNIRKAFLSVRLPLSSLMPSRNALLQNYPNPFNAETWIPYQLARETGVEMQLFNATGQLIKTLKLGHREAGYYLRKEQAAHWNGRNNLGESVASGVYFYTIKAGDFMATRRLVIVK